MSEDTPRTWKEGDYIFGDQVRMKELPDRPGCFVSQAFSIVGNEVDGFSVVEAPEADEATKSPHAKGRT